HRYSHQRIATDGERIYIVNNGGAKPSKSIFMYSKKHKHGWNERLLFAEDKWGIAWSDKRFITGLAVETKGDRLFAAYEKDDKIQVYHKVSGEPMDPIMVSNVTRLETDGKDNLWAFQTQEGKPTLIRISNIGQAPKVETIVAEG